MGLACYSEIARAADDCSALFARLKTMQGIDFKWTSNNYSDQRKAGGYADGTLGSYRPLVGFEGSAKRLWSDKFRQQTYPPQPFDISQPETISISIDPNSRSSSSKTSLTLLPPGIIFAGKYGPYKMECYGNKFMVVYTGTSVETFSFWESARPPR